MGLILGLGALLVASTALIHGLLLAPAISSLGRARLHRAGRLCAAGLLMVAAQLVEAALYGGAFVLGAAHGLGNFAQTDGPMHWFDYLTFSLVNYTTLGLGDIYPRGPLRLLAGIEASNGFLMISCSAGFLHRLMAQPLPPIPRRDP